jgi:hypothetical protein
MGYPSVLTVKTWGFYDVLFKGSAFKLPRPYGSYVMENALFKVSFPAEFQAQTAVECAMELHPGVKARIDDIRKIAIRTHESALRIIDKKGPLSNPADRDHCIQYMPDQPRPPLCGEAAGGDPRRRARREDARGDAGARVCRYDGRLTIAASRSPR